MLLALASMLLQSPAKPPIPAAEVAKFRTAFAEALADGAKTAKLVAQAKSLDGKYALPSLMDSLRAGPKLPAGDPKPRTAAKQKEQLEHVGDVTVGFSSPMQRR